MVKHKGMEYYRKTKGPCSLFFTTEVLSEVPRLKSSLARFVGKFLV